MKTKVLLRTRLVMNILQIEQSFQRPPLKSKAPMTILEKVGELLAALRFILLCKIIRKVMKKKETHDVSVHGFLIDEVIGSLHCKCTGCICKVYVDTLHEG